MIEFGHKFPDGTPMSAIHLWCYRNWKADTNCFLQKWEHMQNAIKIIWPEKLPGGEKGYIWSDWALLRVQSWCEQDYQTWWGPSSSGKSTDAGIILLTHWLSAPSKTTIIVCSTTKDMLERRIWREIVRFHSMHRGQLPGIRRKQPAQILYSDEEDPSGDNTISGIFGVAVQKGTVAEAVGNMVGMHNDYNALCIDEMQATREAAAEAWDNLSTGIEAKFLGMGNPASRLDPLGRASQPAAGWDSISVAQDRWATRRGICLFFNGLKSPAILDPQKYYFLLNKKQIDDMRKDPGEDSPRFWSQRIGFVPPEGLTQTVLTESFISKFNMMEPAQWSDIWFDAVGVDPAWVLGGDRCALVHCKVGITTEGRLGIVFDQHKIIALEITSGEPMAYVVAYKIMNELKALGCRVDDLAIDITGSQSALADIIDKESLKDDWKSISGQCHRVKFGGAPSELRISEEDVRTAQKAYKNKVTELWYRVRTYGQNDNIRGLDETACIEFCQRQLLSSAIDSRNMECVEQKVDMKARTGKSPDVADAVACAIDLIRVKHGIVPQNDQLKNQIKKLKGMLDDHELESGRNEDDMDELKS